MSPWRLIALCCVNQNSREQQNTPRIRNRWMLIPGMQSGNFLKDVNINKGVSHYVTDQCKSNEAAFGFN